MKNLYYAVVGLMAYYKQMKAKKVCIKPSKNNKVDVVTVGDKEVGIHHVPDINEMGIYFGSTMHNAFNRRDYILIDDNFYLLPEDTQKAIVMHEVGHIYNDHASYKLRDIWRNCVFLGKLQKSSDEEKNLLLENSIHNRDYSDELKADAYAVEKCGQEAVLAMLLTFNAVLPPNPEISARYKAITGTEPPSALNLKEIFSNAEVISIETLDEEC